MKRYKSVFKESINRKVFWNIIKKGKAKSSMFSKIFKGMSESDLQSFLDMYYEVKSELSSSKGMRLFANSYSRGDLFDYVMEGIIAEGIDAYNRTIKGDEPFNSQENEGVISYPLMNAINS